MSAIVLASVRRVRLRENERHSRRLCFQHERPGTLQAAAPEVTAARGEPSLSGVGGWALLFSPSRINQDTGCPALVHICEAQHFGVRSQSLHERAGGERGAQEAAGMQDSISHLPGHRNKAPVSRQNPGKDGCLSWPIFSWRFFPSNRKDAELRYSCSSCWMKSATSGAFRVALAFQKLLCRDEVTMLALLLTAFPPSRAIPDESRKAQK